MRCAHTIDERERGYEREKKDDDLCRSFEWRKHIELFVKVIEKSFASGAGHRKYLRASNTIARVD
jgi:hypothetical protein